MTITFPITGVSSAVTASRSPAFTLGTSPNVNDIIVCFLSSNSTATHTTPSGWVNVLGGNTATAPSDSSMSAVMIYHIVTQAEDDANTVTWTFTNFWGATETGSITATVLRTDNPLLWQSSPLAGTSATTNPNLASTWYISSVTPTASNVMVIGGVAGDGTQTQGTTPTGWTNRASRSASQSNYLYSYDTLGVSKSNIAAVAITPSGNDEFVSITACFAEFIPYSVNMVIAGAINRAAVW